MGFVIIKTRIKGRCEVVVDGVNLGLNERKNERLNGRFGGVVGDFDGRPGVVGSRDLFVNTLGVLSNRPIPSKIVGIGIIRIVLAGEFDFTRPRTGGCPRGRHERRCEVVVNNVNLGLNRSQDFALDSGLRGNVINNDLSKVVVGGGELSKHSPRRSAVGEL